MSTYFPAWCRELKSEKWCNDGEVDILESYLVESITVTEAAEELTKYTDKKCTADSKIGRIWTLIQLCADECADAHNTLIELIKAIVVVPASKDTGGVDWTDQQRSFEELWRDSYDSLNGSLQDKTSYVRESKTPIPQKWINFHAFTATIASSGIFGADFAMTSGLIVIITGLEKKSPTAWEKEANLPAALQWLALVSKTIFYDGKAMGTAWDTGSELWHGEKGFSQKRWNFWKDRLEQLRVSDAMNAEVKELARKAGVAMGKAERAKK